MISPWPGTSPSPGAAATPDVPITGGDAEKAGMLPPPPPYDPDAIRVREAPPDELYQPGASPAPSPSVQANLAAPVHTSPPGQTAYLAASHADRVNSMNWTVRVYKSRHELEVYFKQRLFRRYHAVFGRSFQPGAKTWDGDRRTPEGYYLIIGKHRSPRWHWFLELNYPNQIDLARYDEARSEHEIPESRGRPAGLGGLIGIHGTDEPILNSGNINWTTGCISVDNSAIDELHNLLPIDTLVVIKP